MQPYLKKNYISVLSDTPEHDQAVDAAARSQSGTVRDFVGRLAAALKRHFPGASGPTITP